MGLSEDGMQPFERNGNYVVCNGEIYGFRRLKKELESRGYSFVSESDCEILLPLYKEYGVDMFAHLDAEFACIMYDTEKNLVLAARDPIGIRPLFYGYSENGSLVLASEAKNLVGMVQKINPFPPGHYMMLDLSKGEHAEAKFICYEDISKVLGYKHEEVDEICSHIHD